jgi:hypothetical protein
MSKRTATSVMHPIVALMLANTRAGALRAGAAGEPPVPQTVLKGAPSHSGAFLLQALDEMGWELRPKSDRLRLDRIKLTCGVCKEAGVVPGFWYGTIKTCPACHGKGYR